MEHATMAAITAETNEAYYELIHILNALEALNIGLDGRAHLSKLDDRKFTENFITVNGLKSIPSIPCELY